MLSQQRPAKQAGDTSPAPLNVLTQFVSIAGDTAGSVANGGLQVVDRIHRMTLERGDSPSAISETEEAYRLTDIKGKARASSFSGAEPDRPLHKLPNLTSKSVSFFKSYQHSDRQTHDITATAAGAGSGAQGAVPANSRLWGMRSTRSQPWLQVPRANSREMNGHLSPVVTEWQQQTAAAPMAATNQQQQQQQLALSPVRESVIAAHVQLAEKPNKDVQQQQVEDVSTEQKSSKAGTGCRQVTRAGTSHDYHTPSCYRPWYVF
eukprot:GHUV01044499.1.p1 GENE.GHUV01044499.1~~GHUV01044499.1.p1  ORF type:complete len:263 (+),score=75.55 GHUV01044499.1:540-1328(+)